MSCASQACKAGANFLRGVASVPRDIGAFAAHAASLSGLRGTEAKNRATLVESFLNRGIKSIASNPDKAFSSLGEFILENPAFVGGRMTAGAVVGAVGGPGVSASTTTIAAIGGGVRALNGVVDQLEGSGLSTDALSDSTLGSVFLGGSLGGTVNFNAKTGDLTTTFRSSVEGG